MGCFIYLSVALKISSLIYDRSSMNTAVTQAYRLFSSKPFEVHHIKVFNHVEVLHF